MVQQVVAATIAWLVLVLFLCAARMIVSSETGETYEDSPPPMTPASRPASKRMTPADYAKLIPTKGSKCSPLEKQAEFIALTPDGDKRSGAHAGMSLPAMESFMGIPCCTRIG